MATYNEKFKSALDLTAEAQAAAEVAAAGYALGEYLPGVENATLDYSFDLNTIGLTDVAEFRAFDATPGYGGGESSSASRSGSLPPVSRRYRVKEYEQLQLHIQGQDRIGLKLEEWARKGGVAIAARVALAQAQAIEYDYVRLRENGLDVQVNYGRDSDLFAAASVTYDDPTAEVLEELLSWLATYRLKNGGRNPGRALISQRILDALSMNRQIIASAFGKGASNPDLPGRVQYSDVLSFLSSWGLRDVRVFEGDIDNRPLLSDHKIFLLPAGGSTIEGSGALGTTEWGITAEAINPMYGIAPTDQTGIFSAAFDDIMPQGTEVLATAVVIPALRNSNAVMTVDVLPAVGA